jgi:hypothetical protein
MPRKLYVKTKFRLFESSEPLSSRGTYTALWELYFCGKIRRKQQIGAGKGGKAVGNAGFSLKKTVRNSKIYSI